MGTLVEHFKQASQTYSGVDIIPTVNIPGFGPLTIGELQTVSYSIHREKWPVRALGYVKPKGYTSGPRTVAGNLIFTVFNKHIFFKMLEKTGLTDMRILSDELPPFDINIIFGSEYGHLSKMVIKGVTIVDEGQVMSINDMMTENTMSFVAQDIELMRPFDMEGHARIRLVDDEGISRISKGLINIGNEIPQSAQGRPLYIDTPVGNLTGRLVDEDGNPIPHTEVKLNCSRYGVKSNITNKNGYFRFDHIEATEWTLDINKNGYIFDGIFVNINANTEKNIGDVIVKKERMMLAKFEELQRELAAYSGENSTVKCKITTEIGTPVKDIPIKWAIKAINAEWQDLGKTYTDSNGIARKTISLPGEMKFGDIARVRAKIAGEISREISPCMFKITIEEGESLG